MILKEVTVLHLENLDQSKTLRIRVQPGDLLTLRYLHSLYRAPVSEAFRIGEGSFLLEGVETKSPGVMEYYGFEATEEFHPLQRRLDVIDLKRTFGGGQAFIVKGRRIDFGDLGEIGDRIRLRITTMSLGSYLLNSIDEVLLSPLRNL